MKLKIMIMALLLMSVGIGSAVNRLPATEFVGDVDMDDNFIISVNKTAGVGVTVGFTDDCNYVVDGIDDCVEIQAAIDFVQDNYGGGLVRLQNGNYNLTNQISISRFVTVEGPNIPFEGYHPGAWDNTPLLDNYASQSFAKFWVTNITDAAFLMGRGSSLRNVQFAYPDQTPAIIPPTAYPAAIELASNSGDVLLQYINFGNAYIGVDATASHSRLVVIDCVGFALYRGIMIDGSTDADYLTRVHFDYPYFPESYYPDSTTYWWVRDNAIAMEINRMDHGKITDCFVYGYDKFIYFNDTNDVQVIGGGADRPRIGIELYSAERILINGVKITSAGTTGNELPSDSAAIQSTSGGFLTVENCIFASDGHVIKSNTYGSVYTGNVISYFGLNTTAPSYGIYIFGGQFHIASNNFIRGGFSNTTGIYASSGYDVVVMGNIIAETTIKGISITATNGQIIGNHLRTTGGLTDSISGTKTVTLNNVIA